PRHPGHPPRPMGRRTTPRGSAALRRTSRHRPLHPRPHGHHPEQGSLRTVGASRHTAHRAPNPGPEIRPRLTTVQSTDVVKTSQATSYARTPPATLGGGFLPGLLGPLERGRRSIYFDTRTAPPSTGPSSSGSK